LSHGLDHSLLVGSVILEYKRLYFLWNDEGNNKRISLNILKSLDTVLQNTIQGSEQLFGEEILSLYHIFGDRYEYTFEIIDVLVY
jgi:hypothetical protein